MVHIDFKDYTWVICLGGLTLWAILAAPPTVCQRTLFTCVECHILRWAMSLHSWKDTMAWIRTRLQCGAGSWLFMETGSANIPYIVTSGSSQMLCCRNVQVAYLDNSNNHSHRGVPWDRWNKDSDGARIKVILNEKNKRDMSVFPRLIPVINFAGSMTYRLIWLTLAATRLVQWCLIFIASLVGVKKLVGCWRDTTLSVSVSIPRGNWWGMSLPEYGHHFPLAGVCGQIQ